MRSTRRFTVVLLATALGLAACTTDEGRADKRDQRDRQSRSDALPEVQGEVTTKGAFSVRPSVNQATVTGAKPGSTVQLVNDRNELVAEGTVDEAGNHIFREAFIDPKGTVKVIEIAARDGYTVRQVDGAEIAASEQFAVLSPDDPPDADFYSSQQLEPGLNYIETRDGTLLAAMLRFPGGKTAADGPFPTVVEYSGYPVADPDDKQPSTLIADLLGYATVAVNIRATGCSGGAFSIFEPLNGLDGYDVIETVGSQPWVAHEKVGMVGISYPGIMQLFVAATRPPHLASIAPLSVIDDVYDSTAFPGGIFNNGFALTWGAEREEESAPFGQEWAAKRRDEGDQVCIENQALRSQNQKPISDLLEVIDYRDPAMFDPRSPFQLVGQIDVPVFLSGAWQDEQTGGHFPTLIPELDGNEKAWFTMVNGTHVDSLATTFLDWIEFNSIYVRQETPSLDAVLLAAAPAFIESFIGAPLAIPENPNRYAGLSYEDAKAKWEERPRVTINFDNGAGLPGQPGAFAPVFSATFDRWPPQEIDATTYYFGEGGTLTTEEPSGDGVDAYKPDPAARPDKTLPGTGEEDAWKPLPPYDWAPVTGELGLGYVSEPLAADTTMVGPGSVDLWLRSSAEDTDIQVTISEVRPDGKEMYVQSGVLRASHRKLDSKRSTELQPEPTDTQEDAASLPSGEFVQVRVPMFPFGHAFRAGSRIRVIIAAPGGERPRWKFETFETGGKVTDEIARSEARPSRIVLPVVDGVQVEGEPPTCGSLRGEPCREYAPAANGG